MEPYVGIVIAQSLDGPMDAAFGRVVVMKRVEDWDFLLVTTSEETLREHIVDLQSHMLVGGWYAHYFRDDHLYVVYRDQIFEMTTDPETWNACIRYALEHGVPYEQLDFTPRTYRDAIAFFDIDPV